jgi:hypothetical protein
MSDQPEFRDDITCPKSGEMIPIEPFSISKFSETSYYIYCPMCWGWHEFTPEAVNTNPSKEGGTNG